MTEKELLGLDLEGWMKLSDEELENVLKPFLPVTRPAEKTIGKNIAGGAGGEKRRKYENLKLIAEIEKMTGIKIKK